jgi:hypothetical protein
MPAKPPPPADELQPLRKIALSLSGGGFRAAAFSLGGLAYLNHCVLEEKPGKPITLLSRVVFIASASGGSFASLVYATYLYAGRSFGECHQALRDFMHGDRLLKNVFKKLEANAAWRGTVKQRNLINAFSLAYDELFGEALRGTGPATLGLFCDPDHQPSLRQVCVNATEFQGGLSFRFQNIDGAKRSQRRGLVGNFYLHLRASHLDTIRRLKLGDIMAASSCFPTGFEPMMYPQDFSYPATTPGTGLSVEALNAALVSRNPVQQQTHLLNKPTPTSPQDLLEVSLNLQAQASDDEPEADATADGPQPFGLMDGGIDDNQGILSLIEADERRGGRFDTLILCDVASPFLDEYELPVVKRGIFNWPSLRLYAWVFGLGMAALGLWARFRVDDDVTRAVWVTLASVGFGLTVVVVLGVWWALWQVDGSRTWRRMVRKYAGYFFRIPVGSFSQMIRARVDSTVILAADVYLKQIRRLTYRLFFNDPRYENRRSASLIYELSRTYYPRTEALLRDKKDQTEWQCVQAWKLFPSDAVQDVAEKARLMKTTLWFDGTDAAGQRDGIIATGQFTMCYNLLLYLGKVERHLPGQFTRSLLDLRNRMLDDWNKFQENPAWMIDETER